MIPMDYHKLYNNIITNAQNQTRSKNIGYFERHHIVPQCLGGDNSKENLVLLTAREHFIVHMILIEMYPIDSYEWHKLVNAASSFIRKSKNHQRHVMSARQYERIKILLSESKKGKPRPQSVKDKISKTKQKNPYNMHDMHRKILSNRMQGENNPMYGKTHSIEAREKISNARKGKPNLYVSESNRRRTGTQTKSTRSVIQLSIDGIVINSYISIAEAKRQTGINMIANAVRGNQKTAGGYIWKYKEN
jgi:hypothetical protein